MLDSLARGFDVVVKHFSIGFGLDFEIIFKIVRLDLDFLKI